MQRKPRELERATAQHEITTVCFQRGLHQGVGLLVLPRLEEHLGVERDRSRILG